MRCPICGKEFEAKESTARPFCSERCRTIDLGRWLDETYSLPAVPDPDADELPDADSSDTSTNGEPHDE